MPVSYKQQLKQDDFCNNTVREINNVIIVSV